MNNKLRKVIVGAAAAGLAMAGIVAPATAHAEIPAGQVWVCKYVGTPGGGEVLSKGNPIDNKGNGQGYKYGDWFIDGQGRSVVAGYVATDPKPTPRDCHAAVQAGQDGAGNW